MVKRNTGDMQKKRPAKLYLIGAVVAFAVAAAAGGMYLFNVQNGQAPAPDYAEAAALSEVGRLASLTASGSITVDDVSSLKAMEEGGVDFGHDVSELESMVAYGEYEHAGHSLAFMDAFLRTGVPVNCPEHELAHYYVFSKHGAAEEAEHALRHAESGLLDWEPKAREFDERYPSGMTVDERLAEISRRLAEIESGAGTATDEEALDLANRAICVEGDPHGEDAHDEDDEGH